MYDSYFVMLEPAIIDDLALHHNVETMSIQLENETSPKA